MRKHEGGSADEMINLNIPHVGRLSSLMLIVATVWAVILPVRYPKVFLRLVLACMGWASITVWFLIGSDRPIYCHPFAILGLLFIAAWVSDDLRIAMDERQEKINARYQARMQKKGSVK